MNRSRRVAKRQIAVVEHVPTQLVLGLPLGLVVVGREQPAPEPEAPVVALRKAVAA